MDTPLTEIMRTGLCLRSYEQDELSIVASGVAPGGVAERLRVYRTHSRRQRRIDMWESKECAAVELSAD
jgi:hypothetical protein